MNAMTSIWIGAALPISPARMAEILQSFHLPVDPMRALLRKESARGFFNHDGALPRRFEPHHLPAEIQQAIGWAGGWRQAFAIKPGYRKRLFREALEIDEEATLQACSWGGPQIMGWHFRTIGFPNARAMVAAFAASAEAQVRAVAALIVSMGLAAAMRAHDWLALAAYNGTGRREEYARELEACYRAVTGERSPEVLRLGSEGESVAVLQSALGLPPDRVFGQETAQAVRRAQARLGVPADGIVGAVTWAALQSAAPTSSPVPQPRAQASAGEHLLNAASKATALATSGAVAVTQIEGVAGGVLDRLSPGVQEGVIVGGLLLALAAGVAWYLSRGRRATG
jgi:hypothetical protein